MSIIHPLSDVQSEHIGSGTHIWQYCVILSNARIGSDCNICAHVFIENDVIIGNRVTVKCGIQIWDGIRIADNVFIGPNVTFTNDPFPRSRRNLENYPITKIGHGASIGANATILPGIEIGRSAMVAAGAVVTRNVPPYAIVKGNPARVTSYGLENRFSESNAPTVLPTVTIRGVAFIQFKVASDARGDLMPIDLETQVPFPVRRIFYVTNVPSKHVRGEHAHHECHQLLVCLQGSVTVTADNGTERGEWVLATPEVGLHILPQTWGTQWKFSKDAVLAVFASHCYEPEDYIRDYEKFLHIVSDNLSNI